MRSALMAVRASKTFDAGIAGLNSDYVEAFLWRKLFCGACWKGGRASDLLRGGVNSRPAFTFRQSGDWRSREIAARAGGAILEGDSVLKKYFVRPAGNSIVWAMSFILMAACAPAAVGQEEAIMSPPKVLAIVREDIKPGKNAAHVKIESGFARDFAHTDLHYFGAATVTGANAAYFFEGFGTFAEWQAVQESEGKDPAIAADLDRLNEQDSELMTASHTIVAAYREDLSYQPAVPVKGTRYFEMIVERIRPGYEEAFEAMRKRVAAAHVKAGVNEHFAVYQVMLGAPAGTYIVFTPLRTLGDLDQLEGAHGKAYQDAIGEEGRKESRELARQSLMDEEVNLVAINPRMSNPPKMWRDADPEFWSPKPAAK